MGHPERELEAMLAQQHELDKGGLISNRLRNSMAAAGLLGAALFQRDLIGHGVNGVKKGAKKIAHYVDDALDPSKSLS